MAFNWLIAPIAAVFLAASVPAPVPHTGDEIAATVPRGLACTVDSDSRCYECTLGDATADAVRAATGADVAIICGGDLKRNLLPGELTYDKLERSFEPERYISVLTVTPKTICEILEAGLSHITLNEQQRIDPENSLYEGFPQISGLMIKYDASAPPGERVYEIKLGSEKLDPEDDATLLNLAATEHMLSGGYGMPVIEGGEPVGLTLSDAIVWFFHTDQVPDYFETGLRIYPVGSKDGSVMNYLPLGMLLLVILIVSLGNSRRYKHMVDHEL